MAEEEKIKQFEKEQLEILLNDLQDINKFTGFRDGSFKFELGKYQANLLVNCIKGYKEVIDIAIARANVLLELQPKIDELKKENQELKKQLDNYKNKYKNRLNNQLAEGVEPDFEDFYLAEIEGKSNEYDELIIKQKEFIEWLEGEIKTVEDKIVKYDELLMNGKETDIDYYESMINKGMSDACKEVLSKYKSIIGSDKSE